MWGNGKKTWPTGRTYDGEWRKVPLHVLTHQELGVSSQDVACHATQQPSGGMSWRLSKPFDLSAAVG